MTGSNHCWRRPKRFEIILHITWRPHTPSQYYELAELMYRKDDDWLLRNKGASISDFVSVVRAVIEKLYNKRVSLGLWSPQDFQFTDKEVSEVLPISESKVHEVLSNFVFPLASGDVFTNIGDYNSITSKPLISPESGTYLLFQPRIFS